MSPPDLDAFRGQCRAFLEQHAAGSAPYGLEEDPRGGAALTVARDFQHKRFDAGLAGLTIPREYGGQGLGPDHERVWREEAGRYHLMTEELSISLGNCLPVILEFGTDIQKRRHVQAAISGRQVFCQLFSEPEAGSDVASVRTRATPDGDGWRVTGQKVWTTLAHVAEYGIVLARTDPSASKHGGLTMFIVDFHQAGVEIRPIHQIDGGMHFNEVFFDDVVLDADAVIGPVGEGWRVATAMMRHQRVARGTGQASGILHEHADRLIAEARARGRNEDPPLRQELAALYTAEVCRSLVALRTRAALDAGQPPGPGGSLPKLAGALIGARFRDLAFEVVGPEAVAWEADSGGDWARDALFMVSLSISGGTSEIQRNIIGERVLELPREPRSPG
ncbi:MAG: dehydrogenase [Actinomycetia bacterium]|nr:dehydrogenase [Actinomycetes bacterium]